MKKSNGSFPHRRRRKYVRPDLQAKLILGSLGITLLVTFIGTHIPLVGLWQFTTNNQGENNALIDHMSRFFTASFYVSIILTASLATWFGYWYSFRFCGPIYALKKYFDELKAGSWERDMRLRKGDDLQDVKDSINASVGELRTRLQEQRTVMIDALALLESTNDASEECTEVCTRIRAEVATLDEHLPSVTPLSPASTSSSTSSSATSSNSDEVAVEEPTEDPVAS